MIRRAILITGLMVAATSVAAMAFAPDVSRLTSRWGRRAHARLQGFTPAPQSAGAPSHSDQLPIQGPEEATGTYCPIPPKAGASKIVSNEPMVDSTRALILEGRTEIPSVSGSAICVGVPPGAPRTPPLIVP